MIEEEVNLACKVVIVMIDKMLVGVNCQTKKLTPVYVFSRKVNLVSCAHKAKL